MIATIDTLPMAPRCLGSLLYPFGFPLRQDDVSFNKKSIRQLMVDKVNGREWSDDEVEFVKQYIIYYANTPIWNDDGYNTELCDQLSLDMTPDELLFKCLDYGLDPL